MKSKDLVVQFHDIKNGLLKERQQATNRVDEIDKALNELADTVRNLKKPVALDNPAPSPGPGRPMGKGKSSWSPNRGAVSAALKELLAGGPKTKEKIIEYMEKKGIKTAPGRTLRQMIDTVVYSKYYVRDGDKFALAKK